MRIIKFIITGLIGLSVNLGIFQLLSTMGVEYLVVSIGAFLIAMFVGFVLQKYWTFEERSGEQTHKQLLLYGILALFNLVVNTFMVYVLVRYTSTHALIAQGIGAGAVAFTSYFIYKLYIFSGPQ